MTNTDLGSYLLTGAVGVAAFASLLLNARTADRNRPRVGVRQATVAANGLDLELCNGGSNPALGVELIVRGAHDGARLHLLETIGGSATVHVPSVCPPGDAFELEIAYRDDAERRFTSRRTLRRSGTDPLRIVCRGDAAATAGLRVWLRGFVKR